MIKTVFMGTPEFAVPILDTLIKNTEVVLVVTQPDKYVGRKKVLTYSPIKNLALEHNIPVFQPVRIKVDYETIKEYHPDLIVTCAYGQIVLKEVLDPPRLGCINVHASLLPKYRGGAPIHHAIMDGETKSGITIMYMDVGMDTGDMIVKKEIPVEEHDTLGSLSDKLSKLGASLLEEVLPSIINGTNTRESQNNAEATYAHIIKREDEHLDFHETALEVDRKVRALNPEPYANMLLNKEEVKVIEGYIGEDANTKAGTIANITKDAIGIACKDKIYYITKLKPFGKKEMMTRDYLNGTDKNKLKMSIVE